tara:strand:- start:876 stop:2459 length:1584 start_codon:yes stop_codon:yes gene_type:complete
LRKCSGLDGCTESDYNHCCTLKNEYDSCTIGDDCINGIKCSKGRVRSNIEGKINECTVDFDRHWTCSKEGVSGVDADMCIDSIPECSTGFIEDKDVGGPFCKIDKDNNWVCNRITNTETSPGIFEITQEFYPHDETCLGQGAEASCLEGWYPYNNECLHPDSGIDDTERECWQDGHERIDGVCFLKEYHDDEKEIPTNYEWLRNSNRLSCKKGYKLEEGTNKNIKVCNLDKSNGWECERAKRNVQDNDGPDGCCDPFGIPAVCGSRPVCPSGFQEKLDSTGSYCEDISRGSDPDEDCMGEWGHPEGGQECRADCLPLIWKETQGRTGNGRPCLDSDLVPLIDGVTTKSCLGEGECVRVSIDFLCGESPTSSSPTSISPENETNWKWAWSDDRRSCDRVYDPPEGSGSIRAEGCRDVVPGTEYDRINCQEISGKCINNTNRDAEPDHNCCPQGPPGCLLYERDGIEMIDKSMTNTEIEECKKALTEYGYDGPYVDYKNENDCVCCSHELQAGASVDEIYNAVIGTTSP